jgi:purine-binding chemotaxis protein CheW
MTDHTNHSGSNELVTAMIGGQLFGLPILQVQDVFAVTRLTRVPIAPPEIAGLLNLRGRIVTLIDLRRRFGFATTTTGGQQMAVGIESKGESYGLLIDSIGEVMRLDANEREPVPVNLDPQIAAIAVGIHRLDGRLLVVADVERILDIGNWELAA